jgi:hypothetical protein
MNFEDSSPPSDRERDLEWRKDVNRQLADISQAVNTIKSWTITVAILVLVSALGKTCS